jgi:hypothetical protein
MKKLLLILLLATSPALAEPCKIENVTDGDTLRLKERVHGLPLSIRLYGIDTPEKGFRAKCKSEADAGEAATLITEKLVKNAATIDCQFKDWDKYGSRILGEVYLDGKSLSESLINARPLINGKETQIARKYHGEKKWSWCE